MEHKPLIIYDLRFTMDDLDYSAPLAREFGGAGAAVPRLLCTMYDGGG